MSAIKDTTTGYGTITYNGHTFGPLRKTHITGVPVYDDADRMIKYIRYTLTVHAFIYATSVAAEDTAMDTLQDKLLEPGRELIIDDVGFDTGINTTSTTPDLYWGAKPRLLHWATMGHVAAEVIWEVEFNVSRCATADQLNSIQFMAFNWDAAYSIDQEGLTMRTVNGSLEVPGRRGTAGARTLLFNVDARWDRIVVRVPQGFRRTNNTRRINLAKDRIDFSFTDTQLPGEAFPHGIVDADLTYDFQNVVARSFVQWVATLSGSLTVAPDQPASLAGVAYFAILANKVATLQQSGQAGAVLPLAARVGHKLFTRTSHFSISFTLTTCLAEILSSSGIWSPVAGSDYGIWAASMVNVWANRGTAGLRFNSGDERLVDACVLVSSMTIGDPSSATLVQGGFSQPLLCEGVTEANSYFAYQNTVEGIAEHNAVMHRLAQRYEPDTAASYEPHILQYQGAPDLLVLMHGHARRLKFKPEPPELLSVGGAQADLLAEATDIPDTPETRLFDCPVYHGRWSKLYRLRKDPDSTRTLTLTAERPQSCPTAP